ncbi:hypothetical protein AQ616_04110 [Oceanobacillus sp. E9]|nr:hypothetical protein [Oceanobacillus sp. ISL-74]OEH55368.1 hypothetical protein AQ616_04110 [Oceanobacillus sp. E9]
MQYALLSEEGANAFVSKWTNKDWKWLTGILIAIIILAFSLWLVDFTVGFGIISSSVSIALAIVAIYMSLQQSKDNQKMLTSVINMRNEVINHIKDVAVKVDNITMIDITDLVDVHKKLNSIGKMEKSNGNEFDSKGKIKQLSDDENERIKLYKQFLNFNTLGGGAHWNRYQLNISLAENVDQQQTMKIISNLIVNGLKGEYILYNKVNANVYEFVFVSDLPDIILKNSWIENIINYQGVNVLGFFQID